MANTYSSIVIHAVFVVKYRKALIDPSWKSKLIGVITELFLETECPSIIVNGTSDHIHCLFRLKTSISVAGVMKIVKAKSSKWINENHFLTSRFEWQKGYSAFSCDYRKIQGIMEYIKNQEIHHMESSVYEEQMILLNQHSISYDSKYLFEDLL
ncbi:MAG: IS200/IS605 family transposase [Chitinophagaceae bacterium]|nr:IS200/IS605 family transposase [Chitinophagaceae bacterium]